MTPQAKKTGVETSASVYKRLEAANTSQLLDLVLKVPLRSFELAHDSRTGRRQLGALGEDLEYFMPEAVNVGRRAFPDPDDPRKAIYVENFAHVDATVLFMHSLGATQELARRQEVAEQALLTLTDAAQRTQQRLEVVRRAAEAERVAADAHVMGATGATDVMGATDVIGTTDATDVTDVMGATDATDVMGETDATDATDENY